MSDSRGRPVLGALLGVALAVPINLVACVVALVVITPNLGPYGGDQDVWFAAGFGFGQWLYMIPLVFVARSLGARNVARGLLIGGALTFFLATGCAAVLLFFKWAATH